jgi:hypothetical protein
MYIARRRNTKQESLDTTMPVVRDLYGSSFRWCGGDSAPTDFLQGDRAPSQRTFETEGGGMRPPRDYEPFRKNI